MSTLTEVDIATIQKAWDHLALCQQRGEDVVKRLKEQTITIKRWIFFEKTISKWDFYGSNSGAWHSTAYCAARDEAISESEARCVDLRRRCYDFDNMIKQGKRVFLSSSDLRALCHILDTKLED